jgi:DNA-binding CsgD family transcriptional regulator
LPAAAPAEPEISALFRTLISMLAVAPACAQRDDGDVLLDLVTDGRRFQLLRSESMPHADFGGLSPREREIARLIAKGHPNKVIASILEISVWTVGTYVRRLFAKLAVTSRAAMIARLHELHALRETLGV